MHLSLFVQNEDFDDDDSYSKSTAAAGCLKELARAVGSDIIAEASPVLPFIQQRIGSANWREREAAVMTFGMYLCLYMYVCVSVCMCVCK